MRQSGIGTRSAVAGVCLSAASLLMVTAGCQTTRPLPDDVTLRTQAYRYLLRAIRSDVPSVRVNAIETFVQVAPSQGLPYFREYVLDPVPPVRGAACIALGVVMDHYSEPRVRQALGDEDKLVRLSAAFGMFRLANDPLERARLARRLADGLHDANPLVRRHAAMLIGMTHDPGALELLRYFFRDDDEWVEYQVVESMALLGDEKAMEQLVNYTFRANALRQALALLALGKCGGPRAEEILSYRLNNSDYPEVKLAAAEGLGRLGQTDGLQVALENLRHGEPDPNAPVEDSWVNQIVRLELMAASALGHIGRREALPALWEDLQEAAEYPPDSAGVAAAAAVIRILRVPEPSPYPMARSAPPPRPPESR
jgi:HEAT repeat protein